MSLAITINGTSYQVPSSADDTNWAALQVAFEQALAAAANASVRTLEVNTTAVGNVGAGEDTLMTWPLPAATLSTNGHSVRITAWGSAANTAAAKSLKLYFGATVIETFALTANQVGVWRIDAVVTRTAATTQVSNATLLQGGTIVAVDAENGTPAETLSGAVTIKCTGEATNNDDIVQRGLVVEFLPAA